MKKNNYILKGGRVIDPKQNIDKVMDVGIQNGKFANSETIKDAEIINVSGLIISPGFIDMHVHLRQPGGNHKETIKTGTRAAAAGGFTSLVAMPNTNPAADSTATIEYIRTHTRDDGVVKVYPSGAMTKGGNGKQMASIGSLKEAGVVALTDDGHCIQNFEIMKNIVEYSKTFNLPILDHCEDEDQFTGGVMHKGYWSTVLGMKGIPNTSEALMIARNIMISRDTDWDIHMQHISAKESVDLLRDAQAKGVRVTAEVTPHHISLTDENIKYYDTNYKMNPPLASEEDRLSLIEGLRDGTISVIATDHAPHSETEKLVEFNYAPFGIIGLETAVSVCLTELYHKEVLNISDFISKFTKGPADVLKMEKLGTIIEGKDADITILDLNKEHTICKKSFYSLARNTPFDGYKAKGKAVATIVDGGFIYSELNDIVGSIQK